MMIRVIARNPCVLLYACPSGTGSGPIIGNGTEFKVSVWGEPFAPLNLPRSVDFDWPALPAAGKETVLCALRQGHVAVLVDGVETTPDALEG